MAFSHRCGQFLGNVLIGAVLLLAIGFAEGRGQKQAAGVDLLKGGDLTQNWTTTGNWKLDKEGVVALVPRKGESGWTRYSAYLWLKNKKYKDFEADFEYKVAKGGNSGFYFHVGDMKDPVAKGIEVQIYDSYGKTGKFSDHDSGGIIPGFPPTKRAAKPAGEWNRMQVTCKGNKVTVLLNGETVNEVSLDSKQLKSRPPTGYIGFQDHGLPLWLRKIHIREL
jgi:3-keto-disaccharide hydrolase